VDDFFHSHSGNPSDYGIREGLHTLLWRMHRAQEANPQHYTIKYKHIINQKGRKCQSCEERRAPRIVIRRNFVEVTAFEHVEVLTALAWDQKQGWHQRWEQPFRHYSHCLVHIHLDAIGAIDMPSLAEDIRQGKR
jgi:hypothetical protein